MPKDYKKLWENCLAHIRQKIKPQYYHRWFTPVEAHSLHQHTLTLRVPSEFFKEQIERHYSKLMREVLDEQISPKVKLSYRIIQQKSPSPTPKNNKLTSAPALKSINLNPHFTFDNLIVGSYNQLAVAAAKAVSEQPGETPFNPLFIYGKTGLGKSHILQAITQDILANHPNQIIHYTTAEEFTTQFIQKVRENRIPSFLEAYKHIDILALDDGNTLSGREKTQDIFFQLFNHLHQNNKQIIITSDVPPSDLQGFQERILSLFKCSLIADLQKPDLETKIAIIQHKVEKNHPQLIELLNQDLIQTIAESVTTNIREIEGVLISLKAHAQFRKKTINKTTVKQVISNVVGEQPIETQVDINYLCKVVGHYYKIPQKQFKTKSRKREIIQPRQLVMYLASRYTTESLRYTAKYFGYKDHSTVIYARTITQKRMQTNRHFKSQLEEIEKIIRTDIPTAK